MVEFITSDNKGISSNLISEFYLLNELLLIMVPQLFILALCIHLSSYLSLAVEVIEYGCGCRNPMEF